MGACELCFLRVFPDFLLVALAAIPNRYGKKFKFYWSQTTHGRMNWNCIKTCSQIGFLIGFIRNVERHTALSIVDTEINFRATMVLKE